MSDRGEYRSIYSAVLDDPDFMQLSPFGQLVFFHLRLSLGPSGLGVVRGGLASLSACTGIPMRDGMTHPLRDGMGDGMGDGIPNGMGDGIRDAPWDASRHGSSVESAVRELESIGWVRRERNVYWIVKALRWGPQFALTNPNHRKAIEAHLRSLPKLSIVNDFCDFYGVTAPWPRNGMGDGMGGGIPNGMGDGIRDGMGDPIGDQYRVESRVVDTTNPPLPPPQSGGGDFDDREPEPEDDEPDDQVLEVEAEIIEAEDERDPPPTGGGGVEWIHPAKRMSASEVLAAWVERHPAPVSESDRRRQGRFARRIADRNPREHVMAAFVGIEQLFPHSKGEPWDLSDLDRKFAKALAKAQDHPELEARRFDIEFDRLLSGGEIQA